KTVPISLPMFLRYDRFHSRHFNVSISGISSRWVIERRRTSLAPRWQRARCSGLQPRQAPLRHVAAADQIDERLDQAAAAADLVQGAVGQQLAPGDDRDVAAQPLDQDRKSTRLNSSHVTTSYSVCC